MPTTLFTLVYFDESEPYGAFNVTHYLYQGVGVAGDVLRQVAEAYVDDTDADGGRYDGYFNWYHFVTDIPDNYLATHHLTKLPDECREPVTFTYTNTDALVVDEGENLYP